MIIMKHWAECAVCLNRAHHNLQKVACKSTFLILLPPPSFVQPALVIHRLRYRYWPRRQRYCLTPCFVNYSWYPILVQPEGISGNQLFHLDFWWKIFLWDPKMNGFGFLDLYPRTAPSGGWRAGHRSGRRWWQELRRGSTELERWWQREGRGSVRHTDNACRESRSVKRRKRTQSSNCIANIGLMLWTESASAHGRLIGNATLREL